MRYARFFIFIVPLILIGCTPPNSHVTSCESQLAIRQIQTREYGSVTLSQAMRASIATLQDLDFILEKVDANIGTITASKFRDNLSVKMTVTVREKEDNGVLIRASATYGERALESPICYQDFFALFDTSLFLVKNKVD
jgi:hypothetical protein